MTKQEEAQKGFKTFIVTLTVSLVVFSVLYYAITALPSSKDSSLVADAEIKSEMASSEVKGVSTQKTEEKSAFNDLANSKVTVPAREVLAAGTGSTVPATTVPTGTTTGVGSTAPKGGVPQTTTGVPETGTTEMTIAFVLSVSLLAGALYWVSKNPRTLALREFERRNS